MCGHDNAQGIPKQDLTINVKLLTTVIRAYVHTTMAYGFTRAVTYNYEGQQRYYNAKTGNYELKDRLLIDKFGSVMAGSFAAIFLWVPMLGQDLIRLECAVRGKDAREYKGSSFDL